MVTYICLHIPTSKYVVVVSEDEFHARLDLVDEYRNYDFDDWVMTEVDVNTRGIIEIS